MAHQEEKPKITYLSALLKNNIDLKKPFTFAPTIMTKRKENKKCFSNQITINTVNNCENKIEKLRKKLCYICKKTSCNSEKTTFSNLSEKKPLEGEIWVGRKYESKKYEEYVCGKCVSKLIDCVICGDKFDNVSSTSGYNDPGLKKAVDVCLSCYSYEACYGCGYLGGASPCRWCRHM